MVGTDLPAGDAPAPPPPAGWYADRIYPTGEMEHSRHVMMAENGAQRVGLILQPMAEVNFAGQDVPENGIGSGLSDVELGLRLRYEIVREFAPYVGVEWARKFGDTARFARAAGEDRSGASFVMGVKAWF